MAAKKAAPKPKRPAPITPPAPKRVRGQQTKCTAEITDAIATNLELPMPFNYACEKEGVFLKTAEGWLTRGIKARDALEAGEEIDAAELPYVEFARVSTRARARAVETLTRKALEGEKGSASAQWLLERRYRVDYGPVQKVELTGADGGAVKVDAELRAAESIRSNAAASAKIHDALLEAARPAQTS